jgi:hypothetical protein
MQGTPEDSRPTISEYDKITDATANVLARFDWITKVRTASDAGTLIAALGMWVMRVYVIYVMQHTEEGKTPEFHLPKIPNPFSRPPSPSSRPPQPIRPEGQQGPPPQYDNREPTPIDFGAMGGFGAVEGFAPFQVAPVPTEE